jgi:hypothetical protein
MAYAATQSVGNVIAGLSMAYAATQNVRNVIASSSMADARHSECKKRHCEERAPFASDAAIPTCGNAGDCFVAKGRLLAMTSFLVAPFASEAVPDSVLDGVLYSELGWVAER